MNKKRNPHAGASFDDFLAQDRLLESANARALKRTTSRQLQDATQIELRDSNGMRVHDLKKAQDIATEHKDIIINKWYKHFTR